MATTLHNVRRNFAYQMAQISPTSTLIARPFEIVDRLRLEAEGNTTGRARDFTVRWRGSEGDFPPTDMSVREAIHVYRMDVAYPSCIGLEADLADIIAQDRHDICERMREQSYFVGYDGATSTSVGLMNRWRTSDELDDTGPVWVVTFNFNCLVRETV